HAGQLARVIKIDDGGPVGLEVPVRLLAQLLQQGADRALLDEHGGGVQRVEAGIAEWGGDRSHVLDVDAVDLGDLLDQEIEQRLRGQLDHQLVDGPPRPSLEDVDADDVAADRSDAAGNAAESARPVGQPEADDIHVHESDATDG